MGKHINKFCFLSFLFLCFISFNAHADTVKLKNGQVIEGKIIEKTNQYLKIEINGVVFTYYPEDLEQIAAVSSSEKQPLSAFDQILSTFDQAIALMENGKFTEAREVLDSFNSGRPEEKEAIQSLMDLADRLEKEPDSEKRKVLMKEETNEVIKLMTAAKEMVSLGKELQGVTDELKKTSKVLDQFPQAPEIFNAVLDNDLKKAEDLIGQGVDVNQRFMESSPVELAMRDGHKEMVALLLDHTDVNAKDGFGLTLLMNAVAQKNVEMAKFLLQKGARVNDVCDSTNETALNLAVKTKNEEMIEVLKQAGGIESKEVKSPFAPPYSSQNVDANLIEAASNGDIKKMEEFLAQGANVNAISDYNLTAIISASLGGSLEAVDFLIRKGADVNKEGMMKMTALMFASQEGHVDVVKTLLAHGADIHHKNELGQSVLQVAVASKHDDIVEILKKAGAKEEPDPLIQWPASPIQLIGDCRSGPC